MVPSSSSGKIFELLPFPPIRNEIFFFFVSKGLWMFLFFFLNLFRSTKVPNVVITFFSTFCFDSLIGSKESSPDKSQTNSQKNQEIPYLLSLK